MLIARWQIDARFGHKQEVIESLKRWTNDIGAQIGWTDDKVRITTGSIGAREATVYSEISVANMAELDASFEKLGSIDAHAAWSRELEAHVVSGTSRWEILRVL